MEKSLRVKSKERKNEGKKNIKIELNFIRYFYFLSQINFIYLNSSI